MGATIQRPLGLDPMADDLASAMRAGRGQGMDGAFKAVEDMRFAGHLDFEGFIVVVPADFAFRHGRFSFRRLQFTQLTAAFALYTPDGRMRISRWLSPSAA